MATTANSKHQRNIVICLDGTWNNPQSHTNVYQLFQDASGVDARNHAPAEVSKAAQIRYYDQGVGSRTLRILGGIFGVGLSENVLQAYDFLCRHHQDGDRIYVLGYSRGAYTARSLVGLINAVGLLPRSLINPELEASDSRPETALDTTTRMPDDILHAAMDAYKTNNEFKHTTTGMLGQLAGIIMPGRNPDSEQDKKKRQHLIHGIRQEEIERMNAHNRFAKQWQCRDNVGIHFLGVWDTVGSLGIPRFVPSFIQRRNYHAMHDTEMSPIVRLAFHALAIDEHRALFRHTPWTETAKTQAIRQMWFVGSHGNIGGDVRNNNLSMITRHWMQKKAEFAGLLLNRPLEFDPDWLTQPVTDSFNKFLFGLYRLISRKRYHRRMDLEGEFPIDFEGTDDPQNGHPSVAEAIHPSVWRYMDKNPDYQPQNLTLHYRPPESSLIAWEESLTESRV